MSKSNYGPMAKFMAENQYNATLTVFNAGPPSTTLNHHYLVGACRLFVGLASLWAGIVLFS